MLTLKFVRDNKDEVVKRLSVKHFDAKELVEKIVRLDDQRREMQQQLDNNLAEQNALAKEIGKLFKEGNTTEAKAAKQKTTELKELSKMLKRSLTTRLFCCQTYPTHRFLLVLAQPII